MLGIDLGIFTLTQQIDIRYKFFDERLCEPLHLGKNIVNRLKHKVALTQCFWRKTQSTFEILIR